ncbi:MAG: replication-associated recombination protein A [Planctomycetes bacterium]|nr:replication-associated recombination protein A [Planctomycetota bacterium]
MRPRTLDEVVGHEDLVGPGGLLRSAIARGELPSMILWGPPGSGKTTLARLLAHHVDLPFVSFSAVLGGVKQVREIVAAAEQRRLREGKRTILFVDEIHRFNKSQQDAFLPHVERGTVILIGATTENPSFELNRALISRAQVVTLAPLARVQLEELLERAHADPTRGLGGAPPLAPEVLERIARQSQGDGRAALNLLEAATNVALAADASLLGPEHLEGALATVTVRYDKGGEEHYDVISAFIKSLRGSDPDAGLYWLARMLAGGESARFIARRLVVFASEDVGNADPHALEVATNVAQAVELVGLPEARINLAQGVTYLAMAPKSNASYLGIRAAMDEVQASGTQPVPLHLRNAPTGLMKTLGYGKGYDYPHDSEGGVSDQVYLPPELAGRRFYEPVRRGLESELAERLARLRELRSRDPDANPDGARS